MKLYPYLYDMDFLYAIDKTPNKTQLVRLTIMDRYDNPITSLEGLATGGSISVNGTSAIRRQGSLTVVAEESVKKITDTNNLINLHKRVEIELGYKNTWNKYSDYPVIWFPQGIFVISNASISKNTSSFTISLTLKDKMALLNGEIGGIFPANINHHPLYNEVGAQEPALMRDILYNVLVTYGQLPPEKIIIDDVPRRIKNTVRWTGKDPVYSHGALTDSFEFTWSPIQDNYQKYEFNENMGYIYTDFVYPGKTLNSNAGETVVSVLDKIKNAMGNYEYFFDIDGYFRFQEIKNYMNEGSGLDDWGVALNEKYLVDADSQGKSTYVFDDLTLVTAIANQPQYSAIKNDIVIWGAKSDVKTPIRYHLVIDKKPKIDTSKEYKVKFYRVKDADGNPTGPYRIAQKKWLDNRELYEETFKQIVINETYYAFYLAAEADWRTQEYLKIVTEDKQDYLSLEIKENWPKIINLPCALLPEENDRNAFGDEGKQLWRYMTKGVADEVKPDTDAVDWFLDILDTDEVSALKWMDISTIGRREKVLNDKSVNCLFSSNYQNIVIIPVGQSDTAVLREEAITNNENITQVSKSIWDKVGLGASTCAAYDVLRSMLHEIIGYNESITLTTVPIYHLEPNVRISVPSDEDTGISGDYLIKSYSINLTTGGTMSFSCTKVIERI